MSLKTLVQAIDTKMAGITKGTPAAAIFDHVWIGMPEKIPVGNKNVAIIEVANHPTYYYTTCAEQTQYDADIYITILSKGHVEDANLEVYENMEYVQDALLSDQKISNNCLGSTIEEVIYGDIIQEQKHLVAAGRLTLRCRL